MRILWIAVAVLLVAWASAPATGRSPRSFDVGAMVLDLEVSPDGNWVAAAVQDKPPVLIWVGAGRRPTSEEELARKSAEDDATEPEQEPDPGPELPLLRELSSEPASLQSLCFTSGSRYLTVNPKVDKEKAHLLVFDVLTGEVVLRIDRGEKVKENAVARSVIGKVLPDVRPGRFIAHTFDGPEIWDIASKKAVWASEKVRTRGLWTSRDGKVVVSDNYGKVEVLAPESFEVVRAVEPETLRGRPKEPKKKGQMRMSLSLAIGDVAPDGSVAVANCDEDVLLDMNKLQNESLDPKKRLDAIENHFWIEALDVATGTWLWDKKVEKVYSWDIVCAGDRVAYEEKGKLKVLNIRTGSSQGSLSGSGPVQSYDSHDGRLWWLGCESGKILSRKSR